MLIKSLSKVGPLLVRSILRNPQKVVLLSGGGLCTRRGRRGQWRGPGWTVRIPSLSPQFANTLELRTHRPVGKSTERFKHKKDVWSCLRIWDQNPSEQLPERLGKLGLLGNLELRIQNLQRCPVLEGMTKVAQRVEKASNCPNIDLLANVLLLVEVDHLWSAIHESAMRCNDLLLFCNLLSVSKPARLCSTAAKITELVAPAEPVVQNIFEFDVSVCDRWPLSV
mmetsp:Transcript_4504/g.13661  ORF Transcript_4504/g.13661 Transcript_4504/m.13661 type:complete len:224 (-) Transcript_4504:509-1180(-)